jgi:hypothetical protein
MPRAFLTLVACLFLSPVVLAAETVDVPRVCVPPSQWPAPPEFQPVESRPLSSSEQRDLRRLFQALEGSWQGRMQEEICMHSGGVRRHDYAAELEVDARGDELQVRGHYMPPDVRTRHRFSRRLFLTSHGLRVDVASRAGEVEVLQADARILTYRMRFRQVRKPEPDPYPSTATVSPGSSVAGSSNLRADGQGGDAADTGPLAQGQKPVPRRASVTREERFSLRRVDPRTVEVTRQFFLQGAYTGSMTWRLRRD